LEKPPNLHGFRKQVRSQEPSSSPDRWRSISQFEKRHDLSVRTRLSTVQDGIRKIAAELIEDAAACIDAKGGDIHQKVHGARKACKKLRGLIRIVRPILPGYASENAAFREAGRKLSFLRDGGVLIETYDGLLESYADQIDRSKFAPIRRRLTLLHKALTESDDVGHALEQFRQVIVAAGKRAHRWQISADGFDALEPGIGKSYKSARRAMAKASEKPTAEAIHEWRKRVKDHWYRARLLYPIWPKPTSMSWRPWCGAGRRCLKARTFPSARGYWPSRLMD
jgi:hypothetical protein